MANIKKPDVKILYRGHNVTDDFSPYLISVTYTDKVIGESDEIEIQLMDPDGRWREGWYPSKGDRIKLQMGYTDTMVDCGEFEVDEMTISGPPDVVTIRGIASWVTSAIRTRDSNAHENKTLKEIAEFVCKKNGLTLVDGSVTKTIASQNLAKESLQVKSLADSIQSVSTSESALMFQKVFATRNDLIAINNTVKLKGFTTISTSLADVITYLSNFPSSSISARTFYISTAADNLKRISDVMSRSVQPSRKITTGGVLYTLRIARSTQNNETDLAYLKRISEEFGFIFSIRGNQMIFTSIYDIEDGKPVLEIDRTDMSSYDLKDKTSETYASAVCKYHDSKNNKLVEYKVETVEGSDKVAFSKNVKSDTLYIKSKAENEQQAELKARAALHAANSKQQELNFAVEGNPLLIAGNNIDVTGLGILSGKYHIIQSTHRFEKSSGYTTDVSTKRVGFIAKTRAKSKKPRKVNYTYTVVT